MEVEGDGLRAAGKTEAGAPSGALLAEFLRDHCAFCPRCKGDLHGVTGGACPACGERIKLGLKVTESYRAAWAVLLAALCVDAVVGLFFAGLLWNDRHNLAQMRQSLWPAFVLFLASVPLPIQPLAFRRAMFRWRTGRQWLFTALGLVWTLALFVTLWLGLWGRY